MLHMITLIDRLFIATWALIAVYGVVIVADAVHPCPLLLSAWKEPRMIPASIEQTGRATWANRRFEMTSGSVPRI